MNELSTTSILLGIVSLAVLVAFFVMVVRLGKILDILRLFKDVYIQQDDIKQAEKDNSITVKCEKCGKEFTALKGTLANCPECKAINKIPLH